MKVMEAFGRSFDDMIAGVPERERQEIERKTTDYAVDADGMFLFEHNGKRFAVVSKRRWEMVFRGSAA